MPPGERNDPYAQFNFLLEIDGIKSAGFTEASGLETSQEVIEYREGGEKTTKRKLPGLTNYMNISLKRGWTQNFELWNWRKTTIDGVTERKSFAIIVLDEARNEALRFNFSAGWICKWEGPKLNSTTNEVAIEALEICHEGMEAVV